MPIKLRMPATAQPRLVTAVLVGGLLCLVLPGRGTSRLLAAWDCATGLYLLLALSMMARSDIDKIRRRAALQDEGQIVILGLTTITALVSLGGSMRELALARSLQGQPSGRTSPRRVTRPPVLDVSAHDLRRALRTSTIAGPEHEPEGGLEFPGREPPDYWDFLYYSFVIGTACATADINITSKGHAQDHHAALHRRVFLQYHDPGADGQHGPGFFSP